MIRLGAGLLIALLAACAAHDDADGVVAAAVRGDPERMQVLLDGGGDPDGVDREGQTALALATERGYERVVMMLLERGADPNARCDGCASPLAIALERGHLHIARLLRAAGGRD